MTTGSPNGRPIPEMTDADVRRFWSKVRVPDANGCAVWLAHTVGAGYGRFHIRDHKYLAHRVSYTLAYGDIPTGKVLDHLCRNAACVNPAHLEVVTQHENTMRGRGPCAATAAKTHCPRGHEYAGENLRTTPSGGRECQTCGRTRSREHYLRTKAARQQRGES